MSKSAAEMRADHQAALDAAPTTTICAFCDWAYHGTAYEGRELAKGHRRVAHPELKMRRRRQQHLKGFTTRQDDFQEEGLARAKIVAASLARLEAAS